MVISIKKHRQAYQTLRVSDTASVLEVEHQNIAWLGSGKRDTGSILDNNPSPYYISMQWYLT